MPTCQITRAKSLGILNSKITTYLVTMLTLTQMMWRRVIKADRATFRKKAIKRQTMMKMMRILKSRRRMKMTIRNLSRSAMLFHRGTISPIKIRTVATLICTYCIRCNNKIKMRSSKSWQTYRMISLRKMLDCDKKSSPQIKSRRRFRIRTNRSSMRRAILNRCRPSQPARRSDLQHSKTNCSKRNSRSRKKVSK